MGHLSSGHLFTCGVTAVMALMVALWVRWRVVFRARRRDVERAQRAACELDSLTRYANDPVLVVDAGQRIVAANDRAAALLGYGHDDLLQLALADVRAPETIRELDDRLRELRARGGAVYETRWRRSDGSTVPVEVSVRAVEIDGQLLYQGTARDITSRVREAEERAFQTKLLETLHEAVIGLDADLRVRSWNRAAQRLYGWTVEEVLGKHVRDVLRTEVPGGEDERSRLFQEIAASGRMRRELVQFRRDGTRIEVDGETAALYGPDGSVTGYVLANRDVTERAQAAAALRASEAKFRAAFHGVSMGMLLIDVEGHVLECNRAFREMLGYDAGELERAAASDLLHPDDGQLSRVALLEMIQGSRDDLTEERRYRRKDGTYAQTVARASAVRDASGELLYKIAVVEDVTEKREMQAKLLFADRMSSMGTLAAGVAHEINNPLAYILANVSFVAEELARIAPDRLELVRAIAETREGALRVREIVRDLKTFSRPDEKRGETVDVRDVIQLSMKLAQTEIRHRARLVVDLREVPLVAASSHRLGQVFVNLLINAAQSMREGQVQRNELRVTCRRSDEGRVLVEIADTGCGIPRDVLPRIFEPFFTTKPVGVGTGLGLAICHGIVTGLGGEIQVESGEGRGSTFRVVLPPASFRALPSPANAVPVVPARAHRARILVVDDEPLVARAIERMLARKHRVVAVTSAASALACLEEGAFDVVICDLMMPDMTGMELHAEIAGRLPALSERMIFLTGGAFTDGAREFLGHVPNPRLEKPFDAESLQAAVDEVLSRAGALANVLPLRA